MPKQFSTSEVTRRRLAALEEYAVMDTAPEQAFDDLTHLASFICGTPISLVTLLDDRRQWFKSNHGMPASGSPLRDAFCAHAIRQSDVFVVPDTLQSSIFCDYANVTGDPHIRFYAGAPLVTPEGVPLGTLCVIDRVPRVLSPEQAQALQVLARQTVSLLELRRTNHLLTETLTEKQAALDAVKELQDMLPMCSYCKKIRDDDHYWQNVDAYIADHSEIRFSHGICPQCTVTVLAQMREMIAV